jgi:hypothetical protein
VANEHHLAIALQGAEVWNAWMAHAPAPVNLSHADFRHGNLCYFNLSGVNLEGCELSYVSLLGADLHLASLAGADLRFANLSNAYLRQSDLSNANLTSSTLYSAEFIETRLGGAEMSDAAVLDTVFSNIDLSQVKGLDSIQHVGPSSVGIDTIYRSRGKIPEVFLRGCGVPEDLVHYMRSMTSPPFEFYSCFISHSARDKKFCDRLYADLQASGIRAWYFPEDAKWGESIWSEIDQGIRVFDKLIVVCSKNSLTSGPVLREIERALDREAGEGKNILIPIWIDDYVFEGWQHPRKGEVLSRVGADFRGWSKSRFKYPAGVSRLVRAMAASKATLSPDQPSVIGRDRIERAVKEAMKEGKVQRG